MLSSQEKEVSYRSLEATDAPTIAGAFQALGCDKPASLFERYFADQEAGLRDCWVAWSEGCVAGYVTLHWQPLYPGIAGKGIPEIQDLNVLPRYRRRGVASRLLSLCEAEAAAHGHVVAIGVGLAPGDEAARRLYAKRGYVPDGLGVTQDDEYVPQRVSPPLGEPLVLHLLKAVRPGARV